MVLANVDWRQLLSSVFPLGVLCSFLLSNWVVIRPILRVYCAAETLFALLPLDVVAIEG